MPVQVVKLSCPIQSFGKGIVAVNFTVNNRSRSSFSLPPDPCFLDLTPGFAEVMEENGESFGRFPRLWNLFEMQAPKMRWTEKTKHGIMEHYFWHTPALCTGAHRRAQLPILSRWSRICFFKRISMSNYHSTNQFPFLLVLKLTLS